MRPIESDYTLKEKKKPWEEENMKFDKENEQRKKSTYKTMLIRTSKLR